MENEIESVKTGNGCLKATVALLTIAVLAICGIGYLGYTKIASYQKEQKCSNDNLQEEYPDRNVTIPEFLEARRGVREMNRVDSVFMAMSDVALIAVLQVVGTNATKEEIVYEYEQNIKFYDDVELGAKIKEEIIQEQLRKDSAEYKRVIDMTKLSL